MIFASGKRVPTSIPQYSGYTFSDDKFYLSFVLAVFLLVDCDYEELYSKILSGTNTNVLVYVSAYVSLIYDSYFV